jgi:hypothetical protein
MLQPQTQIQPASVDTQDKDRDQTIRGPDIFDLAHHSTPVLLSREAPTQLLGEVQARSVAIILRIFSG